MTTKPNTALPNTPLAVHASLSLDEAIEPDDPRWVNLDAARGEDTQKLIVRKFSIDLDTQQVLAPQRRHVLLFGPIGAGKTTELLRLYAALRKDKIVFPVRLNVRNELDVNNLQYADVLLALASAVVTALSQASINHLEDKHIQPLANWFKERVLTTELGNELGLKIEAGAQATMGLPYLAQLMSKVTASFKHTSTRKESLREVIKNSFTEFAEAFNAFNLVATDAVKLAGLGQRILMIVDGTDKIPMAQARELFIHNTEQLRAIHALVLYTAPLSLKYEGITHSPLDADIVLPIVKLKDKDNQTIETGMRAMRELLRHRIDPSIFANPDDIDTLVLASGGHPRELLRLLQLACEIAEGATLTTYDIDKAQDRLAADFRYWLKPEDYPLLVSADNEVTPHAGNSERIAELLLRGALLQYNGGSWRRTFPVVRRLEGYKIAQATPTPMGEAV